MTANRTSAPPHFGDNLKAQLVARDHSRRSFSLVYAKQEGMKFEDARRSLNRWCNNAGTPQSATVRKLATALVVRTQDLTGDDDEEPSLAARLFYDSFTRAVAAAVDEHFQKAMA